jgi:hypothetical protein
MKDSPENSAVIFIRGGETGPMRYCWLMPSELEHQAFTSYPLYEPSHLTITDIRQAFAIFALII